MADPLSFSRLPHMVTDIRSDSYKREMSLMPGFNVTTVRIYSAVFSVGRRLGCITCMQSHPSVRSPLRCDEPAARATA